MSETATEKKEARRPPVWERTFMEVYTDLRRPLPKQLVKQRKQGNQMLDYIAWHDAVKVMDFYALGWKNEIVRSEVIGGKYVVTVRVTLHCSDGIVSREATGLEDESYDKFGDAASNATAMALKRCFAYLGMGLELYQK